MKHLDCNTPVGRMKSAATLLACMTVATAHAQSSSGAVELEEVIVTAQKTTETASKTPIALSVFSGEELKEQGVVSVQDLQNIAPALNIDRSPFGVNLNIRGVTTTDNTSKGSQGVAFTVDGVPVGRPAEIGLSFIDVERVEVLRGPQGTLYGKSSTGGAVNVITNKPKDTFESAAAIQLGNFNTRRADLMVNVPVTANFSLRAAVNYNVRDGFLNRSLGNYQTPVSQPATSDENNTTGRLAALWKVSDSASLLLTGTFGHVGGFGSGAALWDLVKTKSGSAARQVYYNPFQGQLDQNFHNYSAELNVDLGAARMTYVGANMTFDANNLTASTYNPVGNNNQYGWGQYRGTFKTDSHELRFANSNPQTLEWVAGVNYWNEDLHESDHQWSAPSSNPVMSASTNGIDPVNNTIHTSTGYFAQLNWHATDALKFTLGARNSSDKVKRRGTFAAGPFGANGVRCVAPADCIGGANNGDQSANKTTYRVGADYQVATNQMLYFSVATGYKEGGFNDFDPSTGGTKAYDPEQLTAYELGYKGQLMPNLQFNSGVFFYDYSKTQVSSLVNISGVFVIYTRSVPTQIQGWENELHYKIDQANMLDATVAFEKSKYKNFKAGLLQNVDWSGKSLDKTPAVAATLGYAHTWFVGDSASVEARVTSKYSSKYELSDFVGAAQYEQDAYTRTDFTLTYNNGKGFDLQGYVRNIEDKLQYQGAINNGTTTTSGYATVNVSDPRTVGVRASMKF